MNATILSNNDQHNHYPVLLKEILSIISPQNGGTFIDCTFGQGGYSLSILKLNYNINSDVGAAENIINNEESLVLQDEIQESNTESNGLENFGIEAEEETPNLFDEYHQVETDTQNNSSNSENDSFNEEDEFEIPAFLRRQKN